MSGLEVSKAGSWPDHSLLVISSNVNIASVVPIIPRKMGPRRACLLLKYI